MELPGKVLVYNQLLGLNGTTGTLVAVRPDGCFELRLTKQGAIHTVLLPIAQTAIVCAEPEVEIGTETEVER